MTYDMCVEIDEDPAILHITDTASTVSFSIVVLVSGLGWIWHQLRTEFFAISLRKQRKSKWKKTAWIFQYWFNITPLLFFFLLWAGKDQKLLFGFADLIEQADLTRDWNQFFYK